MKNIFSKARLTLLGLFLLLGSGFSCGPAPLSAPREPGNLFIRQEVTDFPAWISAFKTLGKGLKSKGFSAYSLHQEWPGGSAVILTLKCSNLRKGLDFVQSSGFQFPLKKAGGGEFTLWAGTDVLGREYGGLIKKPAGIVIARNQVKSYEFWKACWDAEGKHSHPDRGYQPSVYSIHRLGGNSGFVLVVHQASDLSKAPSFMTSEAMKGVMQASGVQGVELWYGLNLEEGNF